MLLRLLYDFAHSRKLLDDLAFAPKAIHWVILLDAEGNLIGTGPLETTGQKNRGKEYSAPQTSRPKNAGGIAEFLADNITGVFGLDTVPEKEKDNEKKRMERDANNAAKYDDFWRQIRQAFDETQYSALKALLQFHERTKNSPSFLRWGISKEPKPDEKPNWWLTTATGDEVKLGPDNLTFQIDGELLLDDEMKLRPFWRSAYQKEVDSEAASAQRGICLITGNDDMPIAPTHLPKVKGVPNTQSFGAAIVSFDKPAFASYGFDQSHNAPSSTAAVSAYCNALNFLLKDADHNLRIGQTSVCFWARETKEASSFFARMLNRPDPASVADFLKAPWAGIDRKLARHDQFFSVTLSGNAGRIVVRHWMQITLEAARENFRQWFADLGIAAYGNPATQEKRKRKANAGSGKAKGGMPPLALSRLACATVREAKDLQADTLTQIYRAALEGTAPPLILLKPILDRLGADLCRFGVGILETPISSKAMRAIVDSKTPIPPPGQSRMALIKLILNRNQKEGEPMIEPQVFETYDPAYNCGRLLAVLAEAQQKAHEYKLEGAGIAERYFGTACSSPASVFPLLIRLNRHHLNKISKSDRYKGHERFLKETIQLVLALFKPEESNQPPKFPRVLDLQAQGRFALGFYQQQAADDAARRAAKSNNDQLKPNS